MEKEEHERRAKLEKCKAAVEQWMVKAKTRPRTAPNSYGYCSGKLTGSYFSVIDVKYKVSSVVQLLLDQPNGSIAFMGSSAIRLTAKSYCI